MVDRLLRLERILLLLGIVLLGIYSVARIRGEILSRLALGQFEQNQIAASRNGASGHISSSVYDRGGIDFSLWSFKRIDAYEQALSAKTDSPLAVLTIPRFGLEVPVFEGTDELTLNRGAGRIMGTGKPGESGNIGIAAHRDGFFRSLKDIQLGDEVQLTATGHKVLYTVDEIKIVNPEDVAVLSPRGRPSITLVTCYPFYYVGSAPNRYVVHASIKITVPNETPGSDPAIRNYDKEKIL